MGRQCTICAHDDRDSIDRAIVSGVGYRDISQRHTGITISAISRHKSGHVSPSLTALAAAESTEHGLDLLSQLRNLSGKVLTILEAAEADGKPGVALAAVREARSLVELVARLTGELDERPVTVVNLQASAEWVELRSLILSALRPHPAALAAVVATIKGEGQAAIGA